MCTVANTAEDKIVSSRGCASLVLSHPSGVGFFLSLQATSSPLCHQNPSFLPLLPSCWPGTTGAASQQICPAGNSAVRVLPLQNQ